MRQEVKMLAAVTLMLACKGFAQEVGIRQAALADMVTSGSYSFTLVRNNPSTEGIRRQVLSFEVDGLRQYALLLWPAGKSPDQGWPVLQFNHGFHPDPPRHGSRTIAGTTYRKADLTPPIRWPMPGTVAMPSPVFLRWAVSMVSTWIELICWGTPWVVR